MIHLKIVNHSLVLNFPQRASIHYVYQVKNRKSLLQECNSYIKEYLERNQLLRTTREFERECSELQLPLPRIISGSSHVYNSWFRTIQNLIGTQFWSHTLILLSLNRNSVLVTHSDSLISLSLQPHVVCCILLFTLLLNI